MIRQRLLVAGLSLSIGALGAWKANEGYTDRAVVPVQGDRPTIGYGSTFYEDGRPVQLGDTITRPRAEQLARNLLSVDEQRLARSLPGVRLYQEEYDLYLEFVGQHGIGNWYKPKSPRTWLLKGEYANACAAILDWRFVNKYDCATMVNGKRNRVCWGVWDRKQRQHQACMALQ